MQETILGLDIGTNSTKAVLFDLTGQELATAQQGYRLHTPQPGWAEQDPEEVWQAVLAVLQSIAAAAAGRWRIRALALAAQSGSLIPTRADGTAVYPMITWLDGRTEALVKQWQADGIIEYINVLPEPWREICRFPGPNFTQWHAAQPTNHLFVSLSEQWNQPTTQVRPDKHRTALSPSQVRLALNQFRGIHLRQPRQHHQRRCFAPGLAGEADAEVVYAAGLHVA